jgi:hypothetical protein
VSGRRIRASSNRPISTRVASSLAHSTRSKHRPCGFRIRLGGTPRSPALCSARISPSTRANPSPLLAAYLDGEPEPEPAPNPSPRGEPSPQERARTQADLDRQEAERRRDERLADVLAAKLTAIREDES